MHLFNFKKEKFTIKLDRYHTKGYSKFYRQVYLLFDNYLTELYQLIYRYFYALL